jgi:hypothetical protein
MSFGKKTVHSSHTPHPDERWLVSYADMMTLLFGFFVLMYALAAENPKGAQALEEIGRAMSGKTQENVQPKFQITETEYSELKSKVESLQLEIKNKDLVISSKDLENEKLNQKINKQESLTQELQKIKMDLASKETEIKISKKELSQLDQLKIMKEKFAKLEKQLAEQKSRNFLMVIAKWDTQKHDLDLHVKNPSGNVFDFKRRKYEGDPGELILDSRYGPGAEIWRSSSVVPGDYEVDVNLYNQLDNLSDTVLEVAIVSGWGTVKLPVVRLNKKSKATFLQSFTVDTEGKITLKNQNKEK